MRKTRLILIVVIMVSLLNVYSCINSTGLVNTSTEFADLENEEIRTAYLGIFINPDIPSEKESIFIKNFENEKIYREFNNEKDIEQLEKLVKDFDYSDKWLEMFKNDKMNKIINHENSMSLVANSGKVEVYNKLIENLNLATYANDGMLKLKFTKEEIDQSLLSELCKAMKVDRIIISQFSLRPSYSGPVANVRVHFNQQVAYMRTFIFNSNGKLLVEGVNKNLVAHNIKAPMVGFDKWKIDEDIIAKGVSNLLKKKKIHGRPEPGFNAVPLLSDVCSKNAVLIQKSMILEYIGLVNYKIEIGKSSNIPMSMSIDGDLVIFNRKKEFSMIQLFNMDNKELYIADVEEIGKKYIFPYDFMTKLQDDYYMIKIAYMDGSKSEYSVYLPKPWPQNSVTN
ncbi:MAG: hypothetical protein KAI81_09110 [Candidatus Marinimicrobia bacterium]|nr:hypothetical protein [Candidatus Neomarinimicrobiota bacterium]